MSGKKSKDDVKFKMVADRLARIGDDINKKITTNKYGGGFPSSKSSSTSSGGYGKSLSSYGKKSSFLSSRKWHRIQTFNKLCYKAYWYYSVSYLN